MKKIFSIVLSIAMILSMLCIENINSKYVDAQETNWEKAAVITPEEGSLAGAGYINIEFKTTLENAVRYTVYFDGKSENKLVDGNMAIMKFDAKEGVNSENCEVYSVDVKNKHTIYVVAELNDGMKIISDIRTFYISKKGIAMGGDMSDTVVLKKLNLSWYYNWATTPFNNSIDKNVSHVPMMWGIGEDSIDSIKNLKSNSNYILGYNEPDIESQANMTIEEGVENWNLVCGTGKRTVSPASYDPNGPSEWVSGFLEGIELQKLNCDSIALHCYGPNIDVDRVLSAVDAAWKKYNKPIWLTEISVVGRKNIPSMDHSYEKPGEIEKMMTYLEKLVVELDKRDYIERYAWFPYNIQSSNDIDGMDGCGATAMFDYESGKFTELGVLYSKIGNPDGYEGEIITEEEKYIKNSDEETKTEQNIISTEKTTNASDNNSETEKNTKLSENGTTSGNVIKPEKVKVKSAKNIRKKSIKVVWTKSKGAKKYQIQYSLNKKFKKSVKTKITKKNTYKIKGLKNKKIYYIRVRGVNGKKTGLWSKTYKVRVKK